MLPDITVKAIATELRRMEEAVERSIGWDAGQAVLILFDDPADTRAHTDILPFEPRWTVPLPDGSGNVPVPIVLHAFADVLNPTALDWLPGWLRQDGRTLLGVAFLCEGWVTSGFPGYRYGDLNAVPAMAEAEARFWTAVDTDGRLYQLVRRRGQRPTLSVDAEPTPAQRDAALTDAVYRLTSALRAA